jgi:hypothetical protein
MVRRGGEEREAVVRDDGFGQDWGGVGVGVGVGEEAWQCSSCERVQEAMTVVCASMVLARVVLLRLPCPVCLVGLLGGWWFLDETRTVERRRT